MPTIKKELTARFVATVGQAAAGKRDEYVDTQVKNFALRVTPNGAKSYIMSRRWPRGKMTIKRTIGDAGIMSLADAREKAREWLRLCSLGIDPKRAEEQREAEEARERAVAFEVVAEDFITEDLAGKRRGAADARDPARAHPDMGKAAGSQHHAGRRARVDRGDQGSRQAGDG